MEEMSEIIRRRLLAWFRRTQRDLPWRRTYDPYHVWISEIMLQQTQMDRGVAYFQRWISRFPDLAAVAAATEQEILKYWEGLGYYARARNLHRAARLLMDRFDGQIPCDYSMLQSLPGIGPYTAAAIASIACGQDIPVVDANVARILARLYDLEQPVKTGSCRQQIDALAAALLPPGKARIFNQALMDLGGLICTPKNPDCRQCPLTEVCRARLRGTVADRPVPAQRREIILITKATAILSHEGRVFIQQRLADDIWGGLWEFPGGRLEDGESPEEAVVREYREETGFEVEICRRITTVTHFYTRYKVVLHCFACRLVGSNTEARLTAAQDCRWVTAGELADFGFPAGHRKLLDHLAVVRPDFFLDPCR